MVGRYRDRTLRRYFRADAAFAKPEIYEFVEAEGYAYTIRLPANTILQESISQLLSHPVGRPPNHVRTFHSSFSYQAKGWSRPRRVVAKVERYPGDRTKQRARFDTCARSDRRRAQLRACVGWYVRMHLYKYIFVFFRVLSDTFEIEARVYFRLTFVYSYR